MPQAPSGAQWTKAPKIVETLHYRADRTGYLENGYTHLFVVPSTGGTPRQITRGEWNVGARGSGLPGGVGFAWLPDGRTIIVDGNDASDAERMYRRSNLSAVDLASGEKRRLTTQDGSWSDPEVSPDGKLIAFTGQPDGVYSYHTADLYTIAPDGSGMTLRSPGLDRDPGGVVWAPDGKGVYFVAQDRGTSNLWYAALGAAPRQVTSGTHMLSAPSVSRSGIAFAVRTNPSLPPDVVRIDLKKPSAISQLTEVNADLLTGTRLGEVEEIWYTSSGGARVQGWLVKPPSFDPAKKYPLILEIHGGPHGMYNVGFNYSFQNFAANGFVVLYTNPRGSTGYGSSFGNAIFRAYPSVDYDDLMAGVDTAIGRGYIDDKRMFVGGCSGGGVLSSWVIGHTDRFAAAAVRCPVIDWLSFAGQTDIPLFTYNFFEKPFWEDPAAWLKQSSLMYVGNVKTPTMLMTGVLDQRTPMPQTEEYYSALKMRGAPAVLLRFENEWHGLGKATGAARYADDLTFPGMLHGRTIRSTIPCGTISAIRRDFDPAGFTVVDWRDIPGRNVVALLTDDQPCLVEREVRHQAEPVLLLAHESREALLGAAVHIEYLPGTPLLDPERSSRSFKDILIEKGNLEAGFAKAR